MKDKVSPKTDSREYIPGRPFQELGPVQIQIYPDYYHPETVHTLAVIVPRSEEEIKMRPGQGRYIEYLCEAIEDERYIPTTVRNVPVLKLGQEREEDGFYPMRPDPAGIVPFGRYKVIGMTWKFGDPSDPTYDPLQDHFSRRHYMKFSLSNNPAELTMQTVYPQRKLPGSVQVTVSGLYVRNGIPLR